MLSERTSRQHFYEDILKALDSVQHEKLRCTMLKTQDDSDEGTILTPHAIINKVTDKCNSLVGRKDLQSTDSSKFLSFMTSETTAPGGEKGGIIIAEWRKKETPNRPTVERDEETWHWCPKDVQPSRGFPNGLCAFSHRPKNHYE